jgi:dienelactone hydrolase
MIRTYARAPVTVGLVALLLRATVDVRAQAPERAVEIKAADGIGLKASYFSSGKPGPGVLLVHQCNGDRRGWTLFASALATAGFHVLAPDLRGFGENGRTPVPQKWGADLDAALAFLSSQDGVDSRRLAVGGASCGGVEAALLASRHRDIKALVLISGGAGAGLSFIADTASLPVFGAAAERDDGTPAVKAAIEASKNPHSSLRIAEGREHGVDLFRAHPDLVALIVQWLYDQLLQ